MATASHSDNPSLQHAHDRWHSLSTSPKFPPYVALIVSGHLASIPAYGNANWAERAEWLASLADDDVAAPFAPSWRLVCNLFGVVADTKSPLEAVDREFDRVQDLGVPDLLRWAAAVVGVTVARYAKTGKAPSNMAHIIATMVSTHLTLQDAILGHPGPVSLATSSAPVLVIDAATPPTALPIAVAPTAAPSVASTAAVPKPLLGAPSSSATTATLITPPRSQVATPYAYSPVAWSLPDPTRSPGMLPIATISNPTLAVTAARLIVSTSCLSFKKRWSFSPSYTVGDFLTPAGFVVDNVDVCALLASASFFLGFSATNTGTTTTADVTPTPLLWSDHQLDVRRIALWIKAAWRHADAFSYSPALLYSLLCGSLPSHVVNASMDFWQPIFPNNGYCLLDGMVRWALLLFGASCFVLARPQQLWWHQYTTVRDFVEAAYATYAPAYVDVPSKAFDCAVTGLENGDVLEAFQAFLPPGFVRPVESSSAQEVTVAFGHLRRWSINFIPQSHIRALMTAQAATPSPSVHVTVSPPPKPTGTSVRTFAPATPSFPSKSTTGKSFDGKKDRDPFCKRCEANHPWRQHTKPAPASSSESSYSAPHAAPKSAYPASKKEN